MDYLASLLREAEDSSDRGSGLVPAADPGPPSSSSTWRVEVPPSSLSSGVPSSSSSGPTVVSAAEPLTEAQPAPKRKQQKQTPKEKMISRIEKGGLRKSQAGEKAKVYLRDRHRFTPAVPFL